MDLMEDYSKGIIWGNENLLQIKKICLPLTCFSSLFYLIDDQGFSGVNRRPETAFFTTVCAQLVARASCSLPLNGSRSIRGFWDPFPVFGAGAKC